MINGKVHKDDLRQGVLFGGLSEAQLDRVVRHAVRVRLEEGESLFEQEEQANRFYLMLSGQIKLYRLSPSGNEKVIEVVTPGGTFAEALMFLERPFYPVGAQALQAAEVIGIDAGDFAGMLRDSVDTCFVLLGDMSQRLRGLLNKIDDLSLYSAACRVAAYLVQQTHNGDNAFQLTIPKHVMASRLSVKPETLSRIIKHFTSTGIISVTGSHVVIHNNEALRTAADACSLEQSVLHSTFYPCRVDSASA
ncbi:MAG: Crp/Fnr family transcriptional regulator [gamma proteobacterium symbiont of Phacoides pectinatus]